MTLWDAEEGKEYRLTRISSCDGETCGFLFSLGIYEGETLTVVSRLKRSRTVSVKGGRYNMDMRLCSSIELQSL